MVRLLGIRTQIVVVARLVALVVRQMIRIGALILLSKLLLLLLLVRTILELRILDRAAERLIGLNRLELVRVRRLASCERRLVREIRVIRRLRGVSPQVVVVTRLVAAVVRRLVRSRGRKLGLILGLILRTERLTALAVNGLHIAGRLERALHSLVLGSYRCAVARLRDERIAALIPDVRRLAGIGAQIVVMSGLVAAVSGGVKRLLVLIHLIIQNEALLVVKSL